MRKRNIAELVILLTFSCALGAADRPFFTTHGTRDGLPNSSVSAIVQDSHGFLWLGTQAGLVRYDGYSFVLYENEPFIDNVISHNQVQTLFLDEDILWIGTYGGLNRLDLSTNRIEVFQQNMERPESLRNNLVVSIARDAQRRLWVGTAQGLDRLDEATGDFIHYTNEKIPEVLIRALFLDSSGTFWVATSGKGLYKYDDSTDTFIPIPVQKKNPAVLPSPFVMSLSEDPEGRLWVATWDGGISVLEDPVTLRFKTILLEDNRLYFVNARDPKVVYAGTWGGGLFMYDKGSHKTFRLTALDGTGSIPHDVVYSSFIDKNKVLWIGTNGGGLARSSPLGQHYKAYFSNPENPESLSPGKVTDIIEDRQGRLWVAVYGSGLNLFDRKRGTFTRFRHDPKNPASLPNDIVNQMYIDSLDRFWLGTNNGLALFNPETGTFKVFRPDPENPASLADSVIYAICEAPNGKLWVGTYTQGIELFDPKTGTCVHYPPNPVDTRFPQDALVYALRYDNEGALWIGYNNGLDRYKDGIFTRYRYDKNNPHGISSNTIRHIYRDSQGNMWFGTVGGGIMKYDQSQDRFVHFTKKQGIPHNTVRSIIEAADGKLWLGTATGIGFIDIEGFSFRGFSVFNELRDKEFHTGVCRTSDGAIFFGGQNTLYELHPEDVVQSKEQPQLIISDISINGKSLWKDFRYPSPPYIKSLSLKYTENNISILFANTNLSDPSRNLYSFKLEGFDKDWSLPSTEHVATYTNIPGGSYVLRIRTANSEGMWNDDAYTLPIQIDRPFYLTPLALIIYILLVIATGYGIALYFNRIRLKAKITELERLKKELEAVNQRLDALSTKDGLTGISNRRHLDELLPRIVAEAVRDRSPLSMLMLDI
ncbi:MAG: two-component regulator propeller domain-containing protein, partial [Termitinemataceae bacterium]